MSWWLFNGTAKVRCWQPLLKPAALDEPEQPDAIQGEILSETQLKLTSSVSKFRRSKVQS